jgi:hypothetical protein
MLLSRLAIEDIELPIATPEINQATTLTDYGIQTTRRIGT